jgi:hypothetical protein
MPLLDVRAVYVVQDRDSGAFVDINMSFCQMLRNAAQIDSLQIARQHIRDAICDGILEFPEGYDIFEYYLEKDKFDN